MKDIFDLHTPKRRRSDRRWGSFFRICLLATSLPSAALAQPKGEQGADAKNLRAPFCYVQQRKAPDGDVGVVFANCGGRGLQIGPADSFEVFSNEVIGAVLVALQRAGARTVWMVSVQENGPPLLENISGQISLAAGFGMRTAIAGAELDFSGFASRGVVEVLGAPADSGRTGRSKTIDLSQQVATARAAVATANRLEKPKN